MNVNDQQFLYGVYSIHVHAIALQGGRWDAEYEIRHRNRAVQRWTTVGGDLGLEYVDDAIEAAHRQAVDDIEHGAGVPKPRAFP